MKPPLTVTPVEQSDNITIIGRKWRDIERHKTFWSSEILVNGIVVIRVELATGVGKMFEIVSFGKLIQAGYCPDGLMSESFKQYCNRKGIIHHVTAADVNRKKDL